MISSSQGNDKMLINIIKTVGTYYSIAALMPNMGSALYKTFTEINLHQLIIDLIKTQPLFIQEEAILAIATGIHPFFGEVYSMPWKRGPHPAI